MNIVKGSTADLARQANVGLAQSFLSADTVVLIDVSGSMEDSADGRIGSPTRYERACEELARLQAAQPGRVAVVAFHSDPEYCPGGMPPTPRYATALHRALDYVQIADGVVERFVLISDGEPDSRDAAMDSAAKFSTPIHTIYIGPEGGEGATFLRKLALIHGGKNMDIVGAKALATKIETLMLEAPHV